MAQLVDRLVDKAVMLMTNDGRTFRGVLKSFDQRVNLILSDCVEHVYSGVGQPMREEEMGVYFVRGDNIAMVGQVEPELEQQARATGVLQGEPLPSMGLH